MTRHEHTVSLRGLRRRTREVLARVQHGETLDITDYDRTIVRITLVDDSGRTPILDRLAEQGHVQLALRPGYRPRMRPGDGTSPLSDGLRAMRDED